MAILQARDAPYSQARQASPARWSRVTRNWKLVAAVALNPEKEAVVAAVSQTQRVV
ncbi:hypothetical protein XACN24_11440 [Xanthomonas albilineans]|uniref:Hypothetical integrase protein n=1 Tax=Xanthomonas albilineans (strain GPE PC73 / CFBP 7063) TaxID=380358 RepID=D2U978_XANAP